jgi:hypothetical protein
MQQLPAVSGVRTNYITGSILLRIFRPICVLGLMFLLWALFATSSQEHWPDFGEPGTRSPPELLWAMELVVFTGCALHDAQIAFKRPLQKTHFTDRSTRCPHRTATLGSECDSSHLALRRAALSRGATARSERGAWLPMAVAYRVRPVSSCPELEGGGSDTHAA